MVPNRWTPCALADVTKWSSGGTPSKSNPDYWGGDIPWISAASMRGHYFSSSELAITELAVSEKAKMAEQGTLLLLVRGSMLWNKIPVGITTRRLAFNQDVKCIAPISTKLDIYFLLYWFLAKENKLMGMVTGTGIGAGKLDTNDLQSLHVLLPPLPEQRKIATILSTWDKAISTTERLIDNCKQQKKALMQQLLTGKKRLLDDSGKPFVGEWVNVAIGDVVELFNGFAFKSSDALEMGCKWLKIANVGIGEIKWKDSSYLPENYQSEYKKYFLKVGDIVVAMTRPTLGNQLKISRLKRRSDESLLNQRVAKLVFSDKVSCEYMYQLLSTIEVALKLNSALLGTDPPNLNAKVLHEIQMKMPPLVEQQKIAAVLTNADQEIELLEKQLADLKQEKKALMQQLFTGKRRVIVDEKEVA
ncbi:restriction endonuclease subunit S [Marinomonas foliarum]|uniref:Type I restriction enzyme S subunit n=1 Tax=Marinomonas foliarum TaxID=491950 RepID=A0A368ZKU6_9GAMM|nr:restriction endonuclease subunit S [Marinomonas foliarum]RCW94924.1 type I restriction enzyme S subunit [Marinomonas foliarum]|tara:strand:+ start:13144 stop:14394 length:1251 start_codon:yes stop_codon:yes gene_type:complete